jgi:hypothetical protein
MTLAKYAKAAKGYRRRANARRVAERCARPELREARNIFSRRRSGAAKSYKICSRSSDKQISSSLRCASAPLREYSGSAL